MTAQDAVTLAAVALACAGGACAAWQSARVEAMRRRLTRARAEVTEARQWQAGWTQYVLRSGVLPVELEHSRKAMDRADDALDGRQ